MSVLRFEAFHCWRNDEALFEPVDFAVQTGQIVQVVGPNGAGKTTLLRCLCGLYDDYLGDVLWRGKAWRSQLYEFTQQLLYLGHNPGIKRSLTAAENLRWFFGVHSGHAIEDKIRSALFDVGLEGYADTLCQEMSAGQLRRVGLARLFISQQSLWVLDEPFTAIDVKGVAQLEARLLSHSCAGGTVILTTHQALAINHVINLTLVPGSQEVIHDS